MSLSASSRRLVRSAPACVQRRTIFGWGGKNKDEVKKTPMPENQLTEKFLKTKPSMQQRMPDPGGLSEESLFEDKEVVGPELTQTPGKALPRNKYLIAAALDPDPDQRMRWERKMVIRDIRKRGRMTRKQLLKQQERELLSKSHDFRTSTKKLMHLARQIAGKTVDEAIVQMRFSVKKTAKDVKYHLEHARNEAIVRRGMGLGKINGTTGPPVEIQTKEGKRLKIEDRTRLYIDQAWVGKGLHGKSSDFRARGSVYVMKNRTTSLSLVLKEEATRVRLHEERVEKERNRRVWTQLPNRPITAQRQYYSW